MRACALYVFHVLSAFLMRVIVSAQVESEQRKTLELKGGNRATARHRKLREMSLEAGRQQSREW